MYIPNYYQINDYQEIKSFIEKNNFAVIVSTDNGCPIATHIPVMITEKDNDLYISGHFARGNQQWGTIDDNDNILVIFQGEHSYISSTWYHQEDVPTWNYQSVHIYGKGKTLNEDELEADLEQLLDKYEKYRENGATWDNMSDKTKKQIKGIVGFKIKATKILAAYKLSQKRSESEKNNIINELSNSNELSDKKLAEEMKRVIRND